MEGQAAVWKQLQFIRHHQKDRLNDSEKETVQGLMDRAHSLMMDISNVKLSDKEG